MAEIPLLLSACLAGVNCVYDGTNRRHPVFVRMRGKGHVFVFCPEALGGMKIPHSPSEIRGGSGKDVLAGRAQVLSREGRDVTSFFLKGATKTLALARRHGAQRAIMKARSPSCGCGWIYDGTFSRKLTRGDGVAAALLKENGIAVTSDEAYLKRLRAKRRK